MDFLEKVKKDEDAKEIFRDYRFDKFLGKGGYGRVFEAYNYLEESTFAIKIYSKSDKKTSISNKVTRNEVDILRKLKNEHIIKVAHYLETRFYIFMVMELCVAGDLWNVLRAYQQKHQSQGMKEKFAAQIVKQLLQGIDFLQKNFLIHRDLKPENILIKGISSWEDLPQGAVKIADFGLCKDFGSPFNFSLSTRCGTDSYMAPEIHKKSKYSYVYHDNPRNWTCLLFPSLPTSFSQESTHSWRKKP